MSDLLFAILLSLGFSFQIKSPEDLKMCERIKGRVTVEDAEREGHVIVRCEY